MRYPINLLFWELRIQQRLQIVRLLLMQVGQINRLYQKKSSPFFRIIATVIKKLSETIGSFIGNIRNDQFIFCDSTEFKFNLTLKFCYSQRNTICFINIPNFKGTNISTLQNKYLRSCNQKVKVGSFN